MRRFIAEAAAQAARTGRPICLDSAVLIEYVAQTDPYLALLAPLVLSSDVPIVLSTVTLAELVVRPARAGDFVRVRALHAALRQLPAVTVVFDQAHALEAAAVRAETNLRLPDAAIVATARLAAASMLLGNDRQWRTRHLGVPYHLVSDVLALP